MFFQSWKISARAYFISWIVIRSRIWAGAINSPAETCFKTFPSQYTILWLSRHARSLWSSMLSKSSHIDLKRSFLQRWNTFENHGILPQVRATSGEFNYKFMTKQSMNKSKLRNMTRLYSSSTRTITRNAQRTRLWFISQSGLCIIFNVTNFWLERSLKRMSRVSSQAENSSAYHVSNGCDPSRSSSSYRISTLIRTFKNDFIFEILCVDYSNRARSIRHQSWQLKCIFEKSFQQAQCNITIRDTQSKSLTLNRSIQTIIISS